MDKDPIKEAFSRAKTDIQSLKNQFSLVLSEIQEIKRTLNNISYKQTNQQINKADIQQSNELYELPTSNWPYKRLKPHVYRLSTRNRGVPTDRQTNQQTDRQIHNQGKIDKIAAIDNVSQILESLDSMKKELRSTFKNLTNQEMLVFSTIYQLEEEGFSVDYPMVSQKLGLTESSIRDYVLKLTKKGIPLSKIKENNKKIFLKISSDFKKLASLDTILALREL